jgi:hypothetical protein
MMVSSKGGLEMVEGKRKFNTPSLKRVLRGLGVLQVVSKHGSNTRPGWARDQSN